MFYVGQPVIRVKKLHHSGDKIGSIRWVKSIQDNVIKLDPDENITYNLSGCQDKNNFGFYSEIIPMES
jgi:hypothetical protein